MAQDITRRQSLQTIAWFNDLHNRGLLDLDPPYQRRAVWNIAYRQFFIETLLLKYPAPAIFLYEDIEVDGSVTYSVVDGKQRLIAIFEFVTGIYAISNQSILERFQGKYFEQLDGQVRKDFWTYQFLVEYVPTTDESTLTNVFDRINRNTSKLTRQELRHAKFDGPFATVVEECTEMMLTELPGGVPHFTPSSQRQMKDVEHTAQLLLLVENGPEAFSQDDLDEAYSERDEEWETEAENRRDFIRVIYYLRDLFSQPILNISVPHIRRLRNQADFYSLFGAALELYRSAKLVDPSVAAERLASFLEDVQDEARRAGSAPAHRYYEAARSASNDLRQRADRIRILSDVMLPNDETVDASAE